MTTQASKTAGWRKTAMQATVGAIAGAGGMSVGLTLAVGQGGVDWAPSSIILFGVGFIFALMGLFVGLGTAAPNLVGRRLLNVADAEEIVEERSSMGASSACCLVLGAALMLLAYSVAAGAAAFVSPAAAYWVLLGVLGGFTAVSLWMWQSFDELWRQLTVEISAITGNVLMLVAIVWGGAADRRTAAARPGVAGVRIDAACLLRRGGPPRDDGAALNAQQKGRPVPPNRAPPLASLTLADQAL